MPTAVRTIGSGSTSWSRLLRDLNTQSLPVTVADISALTCLGADLSGSVGELTATGNQHGRYFIARTGHADPATQAQLAVRGPFNFHWTAWQALQPDESAAWYAYARRLRLTTPDHRTRQKPNLHARDHFTRAFVTRILFFGSWSDTYYPLKHCTPRLSPIRGVWWRHSSTEVRTRIYFDITDDWNDAEAMPIKQGFLGIDISPPVPLSRNTWRRDFPVRFHVPCNRNVGYYDKRLFFSINPFTHHLFARVRAMTNDYRCTPVHRFPYQNTFGPP